MITRAARRRHALHYFEQAADQLQLPWLCPAISKKAPLVTQSRATSSRPAVSRPLRRALKSPQSRSLASAAPIPDDFDKGDEYLPFSYEQHPSAFAAKHDEISSYDLSRLLMIDTTTATATEKPDSFGHMEIRGNSIEIEATLEACLQVQRWDRAFSILNQLRRVHLTNPAKLQAAYNRVLEAMVLDLIWNRNKENEVKINKWIEVDMRNAGVDPNAQTFALKIKAALATLEGPRRDRTVRRYWELAQDYQFENQVASLRNILSDSDLGKLTEICPLKVDFDLEVETAWEEDNDIDVAELTPANPEISAVRETDQKGLGLSALKQSLSLFSDPIHHAKLPRAADETEEEAILRYQQKRLEQDSLKSAMERWRVEQEKRVKMGVSGNLTQGKIGAFLWQWHEQMAKRIQKELQLIEKAEDAEFKTPSQRVRCEYGPFLRLLKPETMAALTVLNVIQVMNKQGVSNPTRIARLVTVLGKSIENEVLAEKTKDKKLRSNITTVSTEKQGSDVKLQNSPGLTRGSFSDTRTTHGDSLHWSVSIHARIGAVLCEILFDVAKMAVPVAETESDKVSILAQPVFQKKNMFQSGRSIGTAVLLPQFQELLSKEPPGDLIAKQLPMICKPKSWTGYAEGGYLETKQPMLRVKFNDLAQRDYAKAAAERGDMDQLFAGLDVLGSTPWKINGKVFNVMLEAWNSGEAVANLPPVEKVFAEIPRPAEDASTMEKWKYYRKIREMDNEKGGLHSNRCFQNFQMETAKSYLNHTFYLPHNVDFRGRAYPIPPYLNQMGADNVRGLLVFAEGRKLGQDGLKWLKVHLSNVFGYDKASLEGRAQFAMDNFEEIKDSVENPLTGRRWWLKAEDPWQCLAACHELTSALALPDSSEYVSCLPIHQDGTCNGLQHYAALGGDIAGAKQVNLEPGDKPADVYSGVAELVKSEIKKDAEAGLEIAKALEGRITRKIVKQTVMTNVYGVTFTGAIRQVRKQVDDILPDLTESGQAGSAAIYIARKIFAGLGTMFEGAHDIQYWLGDCAQRITHSISPAQLDEIAKKEFSSHLDEDIDEIEYSRKKNKRGPKANTIEDSHFRSTVVWTTPLNLPVVQPYRVNHANTVQTKLQKITLAEPSVTDAVDHRKQLQGFPPNFVHSLDATHMMLSALKAKENGLTFSAVHDSFWTHAADINNLNSLLREAFITMHSEDIIGRLRAEFQARYNGHYYLAKITRGTVLAQKILEYRKELGNTSDYPKGVTQYKARRYHELVREIKRNRLLSSNNPEERAEGEKMVTAATLFEETGGEKWLKSKVSLGQTAVTDVAAIEMSSILDALGSAPLKDESSPRHSSEPVSFVDAGPTTLAPVDTHSTPIEPIRPDGPKRNPSREKIWLWLPLKFRDVPKKGDFDVRRLRDSTYFFS